MSYTAKNMVTNGAPVTVGAAVTAALTGNANADAFYIPLCFITAYRLDVVVSALTVGAGVTLKVQDRYSNDEAWQDNKTLAVTTTGTKTINLLAQVAGDQAFLPLRPQARLVVTTGAGSSITVDAVYAPTIN